METISAQAIAQEVVAQMRAEVHAMGIYPETHARFVAELIAEREESRQRRRRIQDNIAGSVVISALLLIVGLIGAGVLGWLRKSL
jgi:ApbE superfamily uncharacterized protein (UPF0280 family)